MTITVLNIDSCFCGTPITNLYAVVCTQISPQCRLAALFPIISLSHVRHHDFISYRKRMTPSASQNSHALVVPVEHRTGLRLELGFYSACAQNTFYRYWCKH